MKTTLCSIATALFVIFSYPVFAQVGINTTTPSPSSILDIAADDRGVLFPRVALSGPGDVTTIANPVEGLFIYNTSSSAFLSPGFYYWEGTSWEGIASSGSGGDGSTNSYAERFLTSTAQVTLMRYNNIMNFPIGTPGLKTNDINFITTGADMGIQPTIGGVYKVTFTVTYNKTSSTGTDTIEFYLSQNTNRIAGTSVIAPLTQTRNSITLTKIINLSPYLTYYIGINRTSQAPDYGPIVNIYPEATNITIELLN